MQTVEQFLCEAYMRWSNDPMTLPETRSKFHLPSSISLLLTPGIKGHTLIFGIIMSMLAGTAYASRTIGSGSAWTIIFAAGATTAASYLVLSLLALTQKTRNLILQSRMQTRVIITAFIAVPILSGIYYWINQVGTVEALPIFPAFIIIFYGWTLLQSYFIATPASQLFKRVETKIIGDSTAKRTARTLGIGALFLPIVPLLYGVWSVSNWLNSTYQNVQDASGKILGWTLGVTVLLVFTYFLSVSWGWKAVKENKPQSAIFVGGMFLAVWGYLLYRATSLIIGYVTLNQPVNPLVDSGLVIVSIIGAIQTFARKTMSKADRRWSQALPFLVFAFGSAFAVAQYYFILQYAVTRVALSIAVNMVVFATGILVLLFLIRKHLHVPNTNLEAGLEVVQHDASGLGQRTQGRLPAIRLWRKKKTIAEQVEELVNDDSRENEAVSTSQSSPEAVEVQSESVDQIDAEESASPRPGPDDDT